MNDEIRIGVFVCDCGSNIAGVVDVPLVVEYSKSLKNVVFADEGKWSCSVDYLNKLKEFIKEHKLNRVVIASCTPRTHEPLFKSAVKEAGLNPFLLEFVSIREQVSWVHMNTPDIATQKAKDLIKMGVAKAALLEEGEQIRLPVKTDCLIIGGGIAGMTAALNIADQDFNAVIVEKEPKLGGMLNKLSNVWGGHKEMAASDIVNRMVERVASHSHIKVYTNTEIESVEGYIGNYKVRLKSFGNNEVPKEPLDISTVVVASGMKEREPKGFYGYGEDPRIVTQFALEGLIKNKDIFKFKKIAIINCVDSKNEKRGCCNIGCFVSIKNALAIKQQNKDASVHVLYRDLSILKEEHVHLEAAKQNGIKFLRFSDDKYPALSKQNGELNISVYDFLLGKELTLPVDLLVLTTGFCGNESVEQTKGHLKVSANLDGFFQEAHVKLGPLDFPSSGIALCGCAKSPKTIKESCEEGIGAAMRVSIPMNKGYVETDGIVADIQLANCDACGLCSKQCPYNAISVRGLAGINFTNLGDETLGWQGVRRANTRLYSTDEQRSQPRGIGVQNGKVIPARPLNSEKQPSVIKALCKGCGLCVADCPKDCISLVHYTDKQLLAQIEAALEEKPEEKILGFVCHWCALGGVDMAGVSRLQYPANGRLIRVMCSARVPIKLVERAFELKAAGVMVAGCEFPTCHYITGNYACEKRMKRAKKKIAKKGYDPEKLWNIWCSAADGPKFAKAMHDMVKHLGLSTGEKEDGK